MIGLREEIAVEANKLCRWRKLPADQGQFALGRSVRAVRDLHAAQSFAGWWLQNETLAAYGKASIGYWHNLLTGNFLEGLASNWQAAFLQLASLILFSEFFYQRGAPHSRDPLRRISKRKLRDEAGHFSWFYRNSFFLALLLLFVLSLVMHVVVGAGLQ